MIVSRFSVDDKTSSVKRGSVTLVSVPIGTIFFLNVVSIEIPVLFSTSLRELSLFNSK